MLSDIDIERLFVRHNVPELGRALVRKARAGGPVRKLQNNTDSVRTRFISRKMGRALYAESRTVELPAMVMREEDSAIQELWAQPFKIDLIVEAPAGGRTRRQHTPDQLLVSDEQGFLVEEWREEKRLLKLAMDRPHLFYKDAEGYWHYKPAEEYLANAGLKYRLRSADELPRIYIANLHFLEDYSRENAPEVPQGEVARLQDLLQQTPSVRHLDLIYQHKFSADDIFQMLLMRVAYVDFYAQRLDLTEDLVIYRDETTLRAHDLLQARAVVQLPTNAIAIRQGAKFNYDGRQMEVALCGANEVIVRNEQGHTSALPLTLVDDLFKKNLISAEPGTNKVEVAYSLENVLASQVGLQRALARLEALNNPESSKWSERTMRRHSKRVEGAEFVQDKIQLLMSSYPKERESSIPGEVIALAEKVVEEHHNQAAKRTIASTFSAFVTLCDEAGLTPMSRSTFYEWIKTEEDLRAREGRRAEYQQTSIPLTFDYEHPVHGVLPHEIVYIDSTTANVFLKGQYIDDLGKPTLMIGVDGALSKARALYLSFDAPSANSVLMLLRDYVRRHGRLPRTIVLDNGPEFHSAALLQFCSQFNVHIRWRRRSKARDSTLVERSLGATEQEVIANLEGNTIALKNPRNVSPEVQPSRFIRWTLQALHGAIEYYLFQHHANRVHPRFGMKPSEYEIRLQTERGARSFILVRYDALFKLLTSPHAGKRTRVIDRTHGVFVDGVFYWNDKLSQARKGEDAEVRREMWCARVVYVCFRDEWLIAQARDGGRLDGRFLHEYELARRTENRAKRNLAQRDRVSVRVAREKTALTIPELWDARLRDQAMETYYVYERLGMTEAFPEAKNTHATVFNLGAPLARRSELIEGINSGESTELAEPICYSTQTSSVDDYAEAEATDLPDDDDYF